LETFQNFHVIFWWHFTNDIYIPEVNIKIKILVTEQIILECNCIANLSMNIIDSTIFRVNLSRVHVYVRVGGCLNKICQRAYIHGFVCCENAWVFRDNENYVNLFARGRFTINWYLSCIRRHCIFHNFLWWIEEGQPPSNSNIFLIILGIRIIHRFVLIKKFLYKLQ